MARRTVRCSCGADFLIPEVPPSLLHCPRCGEPVRFAAGQGGAVQVREDIREPIKPLPPGKPYYPLFLLAGAGLVLAGGLVTLMVVFSKKEVRRDPVFYEEVKVKPKPKVDEPVISIRTIPPLSEPSRTAPPESKISPILLAPPYDPADELGRAQRLSARINLSGIVSTLYLLTRRVDEHRELTTRIARDEAELRKLADLLSDRPEAHTVRGCFQAGDILTGFAGEVLDSKHPGTFAEAIREWLATAQPGATVLATIQRDGSTLFMPMWFPEIPGDIVARELRVGGLPPETILPLPAEVVTEVRRRLGDLHPFYRKTLPADDAARLDRLLAQGKGTNEDVEFLRNRILSYCARSESDRAGFVSKVALLESAVAATQSLDTVIFKDGRRIQGQVDEETDEIVRIKGRFGALKTPKTEVLRIERGDLHAAEFRRRYDAGRGKPVELAALLDWCKDKNLPQQRELAAYALLKEDPGSDPAWTALGVADRIAAPAGPEFDAVTLKDGTRRVGIITGETEQAIQIDVIVRGTKSETIGAGKATIAKSDVARVDRMSDAARKRAKERALSFGERFLKTQEALSQVSLASETIQGVPGFRSLGTLFELHSTCPPSLVRETTLTLEEMFNAYRKHFSVRRNAARRIDVYFFANQTEYTNFQLATRGSAASNPAYFDTKANHIAAFYGVQKEEEARLRAAMLASEREIEQRKKEIAADEDRISKQFRGLRQQVLDSTATARKTAGEDPKAQAALDRQKQENLNLIRTQEKAAMDYLAKCRTRANQAIGEHEQLIRNNQAVLVGQTRAMYEILFHESFHAFAANYLWEEADNAGLPRWLHEGMATYFERSAVEAGELVHGGSHPGFLALLRNHQRDNRLMAVGTVVTAGAELFQIQHTGEIPRQEAAYAHAWGLAHYLLSRGVTRDQFEAYVADVSAGRSRVAAFERLAGKRIGEIEAEWRVHINSLR